MRLAAQTRDSKLKKQALDNLDKEARRQRIALADHKKLLREQKSRLDAQQKAFEEQNEAHKNLVAELNTWGQTESVRTEKIVQDTLTSGDFFDKLQQRHAAQLKEMA